MKIKQTMTDNSLIKKLIFKFWIINFLVSIALFIAYRVVIAETNYADRNLIETILQILDILLNLVYSFVYLIVIVFCSFLLFLNLIEKIRNNIYLSLLTFVGIPLVVILFIITNLLIDKQPHTDTFSKNLVLFSISYLFLTAIQFLLFRKRIKKMNLKSLQQR